MESAITWLRTTSLTQAAWAFLAMNTAVLVLSIGLGEWLARRFAHRRVAPLPPPLTRHELVLAFACNALNSAVTFAGLLLWRAGWIRFREDVGPRVLLDFAVLVLVMDLAMYGLHRMAHTRWLFSWLHHPHHRYERTRPLTLFVLSPLEVLGFGGLWLAVCVAYESSWLGMMLYLTFNTVWGMLGHIGVEPFPDAWGRTPGLRAVVTTTFHARHHLELGRNFGFYTLLWDRLFGTLAPDYPASFGKSQVPASPAPARAEPLSTSEAA